MNTNEEEDDLIIFKEIFGEDKETPTPDTKKEMILDSNTQDDYTDSLHKNCLDDYKLNVEKDYKEIKHSLELKQREITTGLVAMSSNAKRTFFTLVCKNFVLSLKVPK